jgi:hypothetical protein
VHGMRNLHWSVMIRRIIRRQQREPEPDVLEEVPQSIGISRSGPGYWYLTTIHGATFETHQHVEIRLDLERLLELQFEVNKAVAADHKYG